MCNAGVEDGLKELREHLIYYYYYNERDGFINTILTTVIHVNHKKKDKKKPLALQQIRIKSYQNNSCRSTHCHRHHKIVLYNDIAKNSDSNQ